MKFDDMIGHVLFHLLLCSLVCLDYEPFSYRKDISNSELLVFITSQFLSMLLKPPFREAAILPQDLNERLLKALHHINDDNVIQRPNLVPSRIRRAEKYRDSLRFKANSRGFSNKSTHALEKCIVANKL